MSQFSRRQILLVEDEALIALSEKMQLEKCGYAVRTVSSGEAAVEAVQGSSDIDLILMDINLGNGIDGTEAAEIILQDQDIPIVFLSSHTEPEVVEKTEKITSYGYVVKNSSITVLDASIKMAFRLFDSKVREYEKERSLRQSETRLRQVTESMEEVFWLTNHDNTEMLYISPSYEAVWGRTCQSLYDNPQSFLDAVYEEDRPAVLTAYSAYSRGERFDLEYRIKQPHGEIRWIRAQMFPVRNEAGEVVSNSGIAIDITERKQAAEAMTEQRNFAESLIETAQTIILVLDAEGNIVRFNPYTAELLGYAVDEVKGQKWVETCVEPEQRPAVKELIHQTMIDEQTRRNVNPIITNNGRRILVEWSNNILVDTDGRTVGVLATGNDITDRSRVENTLHESILRHRELEAHIPVGVYIVWMRANGKKEFEYVSDRWCEIHGVEKEAVLADADAVDQLVHPDDRASFDAGHQESAQQETSFTWEGRFFRGSDGIRWFRVESTPLRYDDGDIRWFGVSQDITDRKQVEQQLTDQKQYLERVLETTSDGFWIVAPDKKIIRVNPAYCRMSGYSRSELTAMMVNDVDAIEDPQETANRVQQIMERGSITFETRHRRKDGSVFAVEVTSSRLDDADGRYLVSFIRDISERKRSDLAIQQLLTEKETLIGEIQHRIKNNINIVTSLLALQAESLIDTTAKDALLDARNRLDSLGVLYEYLNSADANGHGSLREYLRRLLAGEITLFSDSQRVAIRLEVEDRMCSTKTLSTLGLIVNELVTNAMKYAFGDHHSPMLTVTGTGTAQEYTLTVADNGPGMPEPEARHSPGFGNMVMDALTQQLNGTISITSEHGTRAVIVFPLPQDR